MSDHESMKASAYADALDGMADGMERRFVLFRPPGLIISVLRRAAEHLRKMADLLDERKGGA